MGVVDNLHTVNGIIQRGCEFAHRPPADVACIAVTKTYDADHIRPVLDHGHVHFGENRVQEAVEKWTPLKHQYPNAKLHLIGALQTNKINAVLPLFDFIHTVDRESLAVALAKKLPEHTHATGRDMGLTVQINTGEEPQKSGISPLQADDFIGYCINDLKLPILGLMCIPPASDEPTPHFALLKTMAQRHNLGVLSMGMSGDFEHAVRFGATHVRVGSAIFGSRT